jgi:two-component system chemotaxis response regulator CheB
MHRRRWRRSNKCYEGGNFWEERMSAVRIVVIGASAGAIEPLGKLLSILPADLAAALFIVLHIPVQADELLPSVLAGKTSQVQNAVHGQKFVTGNVYVGPPDFHLSLEGAVMQLDHGPRINSHRPAIDHLFRSAAKYHGPNVTGILLSGYLDDGVAGLNVIKTHGGTTMVQTPEEAVVPDLVENALRNVRVDYCLPVAEIGVRLVAGTHAARNPVPPLGKAASTDIPRGLENMINKLGAPSPYICPECNGPLWDVNPSGEPYFSCHVGHQYSPESLIQDQERQLEGALWSAVRLFDEQADLLKRLMKRDVKGTLLEKWQSRAEQSQLNADAIRSLLQRPKRTVVGKLATEAASSQLSYIPDAP